MTYEVAFCAAAGTIFLCSKSFGFSTTSTMRNYITQITIPYAQAARWKLLGTTRMCLKLYNIVKKISTTIVEEGIYVHFDAHE